VKLSCIADVGTGQRRGCRFRQCPSPLDVERHGIDEMDLVTTPRQRQRVDASAAADIQHCGGRRGEMPLDDFPRAKLFKSSDRGLEPPFFHPLTVVVQNLGREHRDSIKRGDAGPIRSWKMAVKKKQTRKPQTPPIELIVRRGALRRFDKLTQATKALPVKVIWDRRTASGTAKPDAERERGRPERRQQTPFTWTAADFVVVEGRKTRSRSKKRQS